MECMRYITTLIQESHLRIEVIMVCCNGNIYTFKGSVQISYVDTEPYATVKQCNLVNSDEVHIYVPKGTVSYEESVNISR